MSHQKKSSSALSETDRRVKSTFPNANHIIIPLLSTCFWFSLFFLSYHFPYFEPPAGLAYAWANKLTSIVHYTFVPCMAILFLQNKLSEKTWRKVVHTIKGYTLYDMLCLTLFPAISKSPTEYYFYLAHHLCVLSLLYIINRSQHLLARGLLSGLSVPFLFIVWYMKRWHLTDHPIYYIMFTLLFLSHLLFRVYNLSYLAISFIKKRKKDLHPKGLVFIPILLLNYYWLYCMIEKAIKVLIANFNL